MSLTGFEPKDSDWANQALTGGTAQVSVAQSGLYIFSVWLWEDGLLIAGVSPGPAA